MATHRMTDTVEYRAWTNIHQRCENPNAGNFEDYGGRGISVSPCWASFEAFFEDMGPRPVGDYSIDRKDCNGDYSPMNCRWATKEEQANNKNNTRLISFNGETLSVSMWAHRSGIPASALWNRLFTSKWPVGLALSLPLQPGLRSDGTKPKRGPGKKFQKSL